MQGDPWSTTAWVTMEMGMETEGTHWLEENQEKTQS
jgi:hypothetical protein